MSSPPPISSVAPTGTVRKPKGRRTCKTRRSNGFFVYRSADWIIVIIKKPNNNTGIGIRDNRVTVYVYMVWWGHVKPDWRVIPILDRGRPRGRPKYCGKSNYISVIMRYNSDRLLWSATHCPTTGFLQCRYARRVRSEIVNFMMILFYSRFPSRTTLNVTL